MDTRLSITSRLWKCVRKALPKAGKTCLWLLKIILPISLLVRILQYSGLLSIISGFLAPVFSQIGLPGETAIVFITSVFSPLYAPIALITSMSLDVREATILALMCLTTHNLIVESSVQSKTGSTFWHMSCLRITMSFVIAFVVNKLMPLEGWGQTSLSTSAASCTSWLEVFQLWFTSSMGVIFSILWIVTALMILHYILDEFHLMKGLSQVFAPLMRLFGLPKNTAFLWLVGNIVGLAYGSAIMVEQMEQKQLTPADGDLLNHHLAISHSLLEDTIIFVAIGVPALWLISTRLFFAIAVVWLYKGYLLLYHRRKLTHIYD